MYKFDQKVKKWKERGVGEMKLLRHRVTRKPRLIMRRDQVHKICANHSLIATMKLEPFATNELTVTWTAFQDISEGEPEDLLLAARFKNTSILSEFKDVFIKLCNNKDDLQPIDCTIVPEEGSQKNQQSKTKLVGSCDPRLSEVMKNI